MAQWIRLLQGTSEPATNSVFIHSWVISPDVTHIRTYSDTLTSWPLTLTFDLWPSDIVPSQYMILPVNSIVTEFVDCMNYVEKVDIKLNGMYRRFTWVRMRRGFVETSGSTTQCPSCTSTILTGPPSTRSRFLLTTKLARDHHPLGSRSVSAFFNTELSVATKNKRPCVCKTDAFICF